LEEVTVRPEDYSGSVRPTWCPGCGNYAIMAALKAALAELGIPPHRTVLVSGIGCGSRMPYFMRANGLHTLHGRPIAVAMGVKLVRPDLNVIVVAGDGDTYGIGVSHFIHAFRLNVGITILVQNNGVFGLTRGQPSPTAPRGFRGAIYRQMNPLLQALASGAKFVARAWTGDPRRLREVVKEAIRHAYIRRMGTAYVDIVQLCVTYYPRRDDEPFTEYYRRRVYYVDDDPSYDQTDFKAAVEAAAAEGEKIPMGVIYHVDDEAGFEESYGGFGRPPALQDITSVDIGYMLERLR